MNNTQNGRNSSARTTLADVQDDISAVLNHVSRTPHASPNIKYAIRAVCRRRTVNRRWSSGTDKPKQNAVAVKSTPPLGSSLKRESRGHRDRAAIDRPRISAPARAMLFVSAQSTGPDNIHPMPPNSFPSQERRI